MNKSNISISVIVPIYNAEKYLVRCLESIVEQTYSNLEIILVDDGSTDESLKICEEFGKRDRRIHIIHKENGGQQSARTAGVQKATGDYIAFVDADDYIDADTYERLMKKLYSSDIDILLYGLWEDYEDHSVLKQNHYPNKVYERADIEKELFPSMLSYGDFFDFGILPNLWCKLIKRSFWIESRVVVAEGIRIGEDADAVYQLLVNAQSVQVLEEAPYHYCKRNDSVMWQEIAEEAIIELENDLCRVFKRVGCLEIMQEQLKDYIAFVTLLKKPDLILKDWDIFQNRRVALYGAGGLGQAVHAAYNSSIVQWVDKDYQKYHDIGLQVNAVESLSTDESVYDVIFIAILNVKVCKSIKKYLREQGIEKEIYYYER